MRKVYISKNYTDKFTASSKAKCDCEDIAVKCGYKNIGLNRKFYSNSFIGRAWTLLSNLIAYIRMPKNSTVFLQYPVAFFNLQIRRAAKCNNTIITLIHDINSLRNLDDHEKIKALEDSDILIVHTERMREWWVSNMNYKRIIVLEVFDYLYNFKFDIKVPEYNKDRILIAFAGNLSKSMFIDKIRPTENINFKLFGIGIQNRSIDNNIQYIGSFPSDKLWENLDSHFGLVWDGESIDTCSGGYGYYLKFIAPHKLSLYLSCGLPLIVWKESAMSTFVVNNKIGLVINSFDDLYLQLCNLSESDYHSLVSNVAIIRDRILTGYYLSKALTLVE